MDQRAELSEFLRSRRARLKPEDVGLPDFGRHRRVPGLRREELAQLAGVSVAYYTRLEQGNGRNVSMGVLDAIARALRLSDAERDHLTHLAKPSQKRRRPTRPQRLRPGLQQLMDAMEGVPAYVMGRRTDVLGCNRMARVLFGDITALPAEERNLARLLFLGDGFRDVYADWELKACEVVSYLRLDAGCHPDDPLLSALVGELSVKNELFRSLWAAHHVKDKGHGTKRLHHPLAGELTLAYETLTLPDDPEQHLITFHAEPGSPSWESLQLLANWGTDVAVEVRG
ncbi:helix-turn-helix transcriptional regulator [Streptomyces enissocaesilis]|uniref:Helix-turn-helix transcriptional regulator n=1 Tax=Streptomyces enissocaesilis TaxID=332589 RepID=A0ABP6JZ94_9ACTN